MRRSTLLAITAAITIPAIANAQSARPDRFHQVAPQYVQPIAQNIVTAKPVGTSLGSTAAPWYEQGPLQTSNSAPSGVQRTVFTANQAQSSTGNANAADYPPTLQNQQAPPSYLPPQVVTQAPSTSYAAPLPSTTYSAPAPTTTGVRPAVCYSQAPSVAPATYSAPAPIITTQSPIVTSPPVITGPTVVSPPPVRFNTTYRPILPVAGIPADFSVGQGLYGQPRVYVDNQPVRNFFRYMLP